MWQEFNNKKISLLQWVHEAEALYNSDKLQPGNATVTEQSLRNAEVCTALINILAMILFL